MSCKSHSANTTFVPLRLNRNARPKYPLFGFHETFYQIEELSQNVEFVLQRLQIFNASDCTIIRDICLPQSTKQPQGEPFIKT